MSKPKHHKPQRVVPLVREPGMLYRVRCKDWVNLWGESLSWEDAHKLKEDVVGRRLSKTARVEPMRVPAPKDAPPISPIGRVVLANSVRPPGVAHDDELDELEDSNDAGDIDRLVDEAIEAAADNDTVRYEDSQKVVTVTAQRPR